MELQRVNECEIIQQFNEKYKNRLKAMCDAMEGNDARYSVGFFGRMIYEAQIYVDNFDFTGYEVNEHTRFRLFKRLIRNIACYKYSLAVIEYQELKCKDAEV